MRWSHARLDNRHRVNEIRRHKFALTMAQPSELDDVVDAITDFARRSNCKIHLEQYGGTPMKVTWGIVHPGGPYPLLREVARFLDVDHHSLVIPTEAIGDQGTGSPALLTGRLGKRVIITPSTDKAVVELRILVAFQPHRSGVCLGTT